MVIVQHTRITDIFGAIKCTYDDTILHRTKGTSLPRGHEPVMCLGYALKAETKVRYTVVFACYIMCANPMGNF